MYGSCGFRGPRRRVAALVALAWLGVAWQAFGAPPQTGDILQQCGFGQLYCAALAPGGEQLATSGRGGVFLWDVATGTMTHAIGTKAVAGHHTNVVESIAWSPDGTRVLTGSYDDTAKVWDARTGALVTTFRGHTHAVQSVAFSPAGTYAVSGSWDGTARLWDAETGEETRMFAAHEGDAYGVVMSPDGAKVLATMENGVAVLWDAATGIELNTFSLPAAAIYAASFSPDGTRLIVGLSDDTARVWDANTGAELLVLRGHTRSVDAARFSRDGSRVLTLSSDGTVKLWDAFTGSELASVFTGTMLYATLLPDTDLVLTASRWDDTARLWDAATGVEVRTVAKHSDTFYSVAFSPDGTRMVTGSYDTTARIWDVRTGAEIRALRGHVDTVLSVAFSPDGARVLTGCYDGLARLWDVETGTAIVDYVGHVGAVNSVAFSPDGSRVLTGSDDTFAGIWETETGVGLVGLEHEDDVLSVAFSPDGARVVTGSEDDVATLWDAAAGTEILAFLGHADEVLSVTFSPDGEQVLTGSYDGSAKLWDTATGVEIRTLWGHWGGVTSASFSPDGAQILTGSYDGTAKLWDAATGTVVRTLTEHTWGLTAVAFSPDGTRLLTAAGDGLALTWALLPFASLRGTVTYQDGLPITCASVAAYGSDGIGTVSITDDAGAYAFPALPPGEYLLVAHGSGSAGAEFQTTLLQSEEREIDLMLPAADAAPEVAGLVTEIATGAPLSGVLVQAWAGGALLAETYTCASGRYELRGLVEGRKQGVSIALVFIADGFEEATREIVAVAGETQEVDVALERKVTELCSLVGEVTAGGVPVAGAKVTLERYGVGTHVWTDALGMYAIGNLDAGHQQVRASAPDLPTVTRDVYLAQGSVATRLDLELVGAVAGQGEGEGEGGGPGCAGMVGSRSEIAGYADLLIALMVAAILLVPRRSRPPV